MEDEVDTTDGGRNSSSLMASGLPSTGFFEIAGDGDGGQLSSVVVTPGDGVPLSLFWTRKMSLTACGSGLEVRSVIACEIWELGRVLICLEGGLNIDDAMDAEDLERGKGEIGTVPIPPTTRDAGRTGLTSLARAEEEATLRSLELPVKLLAVASRLALVKIGLRFALEVVGLWISTVAWA